MSKKHALIKQDSDTIEIVQSVSSHQTTRSETNTANEICFESPFETFDASTSESENTINRQRLKNYNKFTTKLLKILKEQDFEYGIDSPADLFIRNFMRQNKSIAKEWLNTIFITYFHDIKVIIGLLHIISRLEFLQIYPEGPTMALAALSHDNAEIRECGIRAFENWGSIQSLNILKNINCPEEWLQDYLIQVIADLEEELEYNATG